MRVLVTGSTGFVGKVLVAELMSRNFDIIAVGGRQSGEFDRSKGKIEFHSIDVANADRVAELLAVEKADVVVHAAGIAHRFGGVSESEFQNVNVGGVENIARLAGKLGVKHFILFSSTLVYGRRLPKNENAGAITETSDCQPHDPYGRSKLDGELIARSICEENGMDLTIFRPAPIIGEGSKGNFARLIRAIDDRRFVWVGNGENLKSVVYVGDVAKAVAEVALGGGKGIQVFNLSAEPIRMKEIVNTIGAELGRGIFPIRLPARPLKWGIDTLSAILFRERFKSLSTTLTTWLADDVYSNVKLKNAYGFTPQTDVRTAIMLETSYYLKHK